MAYFDFGFDATASGTYLATMGGRLKEAKMVILSRKQKRPYDVIGIFGALCGRQAAAALICGVTAAAVGAFADADEGLFPCPWVPNILTNRESLYTHIDMFTMAVVRNFMNPVDTLL